MSDQTLNNEWFSENSWESNIAAINIIRHDYIRRLWVYNYSESSFHISVTCITSNLLYDELRARKQL